MGWKFRYGAPPHGFDPAGAPSAAARSGCEHEIVPDSYFTDTSTGDRRYYCCNCPGTIIFHRAPPVRVTSNLPYDDKDAEKWRRKQYGYGS